MELITLIVEEYDPAIAFFTQALGFDLVEVNPRLDRDGQSARWAALAVWHFLSGLDERGGP